MSGALSQTPQFMGMQGKPIRVRDKGIRKQWRESQSLVNLVVELSVSFVYIYIYIFVFNVTIIFLLCK